MEENLYTLKLDAAWRPIEVIPAYRGFVMAWSGRANIVENYNIGPITDKKYPAVIILKSYISKRKISIPCNRKNVFWRDKYICQYCGKKFSYGNLTMDHVIPKSKGGHRTWDNIVSACHKCNNRKGSKTPNEANMYPLTKPVSPNIKLIDIYRNLKIPKLWEPFLY